MRCPFCIKICSKCKRILVAIEMNFRKNKKGQYKLRADCRECEKIYKNQKRKDDKKEMVNKYNFIEIVKSDKVWNHCPFCIKVCTKCNNILIADLNNFRKEENGMYNLTSICRKCERLLSKQYREENIDKINKYRENNKERKRKTDKEYREKNRDVLKQYFKQYYEEHKEEKEKYRKQYYEENKEELLKKQREYNRNNKEEIKKKRKSIIKTILK